MKNKIALALLVSVIFLSCKQDSKTLFQRMDAGHTGIRFQNTITESDTMNILTQEYIYNGGGVAVADFNNDGLQDVFFSGNLVPNKLYLNKGEFKFEDISTSAGIEGNGQWCSGVAVVDINADGWQDLYVCSTFRKDPSKRKNLLYVSRGADADGKVSFDERAHEYGIDDDGFSTNAAFLDYDKDGDLDLYILQNILNEKIPTNYRPKITDGSALNNDQFYRNNGNGTFTNVSKEAGITLEGYGLGLAIADFNNDTWPDIYVSNDYLSNDILYINQKNGTFKNEIAKMVKHQSMFSMGNDAADFNNDGLVDVVTLDMLGETNFRQKTTMGGKNYLTYINNERYGYEYEYIRNMLQMNNGADQHGNYNFSEIGMLAGIYRTDWSWSPLFVDVDNDGWKDLLITNGFPKDITDRDFAIYRSLTQNLASSASLTDSIPVAKVPNYAFKNNGDLTFTDKSREWGIAIPSFSNGAAFADLDNDGDLDYIVNNIDDEAFILRNTVNDESSDKSKQRPHYIRFKLKGIATNSEGLGTTATLFIGSDRRQFQHQSLYRGYLSTTENVLHFGLGTQANVDSVLIQWPDGKVEVLKNPEVDKVHIVDYKNASDAKRNYNIETSPLLKEVDVNFVHQEPDFIDFNYQRTLHRKFSQSGPGIAVGDMNGDGLEDFVIGGSSGSHRTFAFQTPDGKFIMKDAPNAQEEDEGLLLFDANNDKKLDLYVVTGGSDQLPGALNYEDKLFINDGRGNFKWDEKALPKISSSGSCVRATDFDRDGDLDLFVGSRVEPGSYPKSGRSVLLQNNGGVFVDVTDDLAPGLSSIGMVTDAIWSDYDNDAASDLIVVGEFMPATIFHNANGKFTKLSSSSIDNKVGWWNSIVAGDFDLDGDTDYVCGNLGNNNNFHVSDKTPVQLMAKDFDNNGSIDPIFSCYFKETLESDSLKLYPIHFWDELNSQSPKFRQQFTNFKHYARTSTEKLFSSKDLEGAMILQANYFSTAYVRNDGNGNFTMTALPVLAQLAPVNGMIVDDVNNDGFSDLLLTGNDFGNEIFIGRYDAMNGVTLLGNGAGQFTPETQQKSGFVVAGDAKAAVRLKKKNNDVLILVSQNRGALKAFEKQSTESFVTLNSDDAWMECTFENGKKQKIERYWGSGYLSQGTMQIPVPANATKVEIVDAKQQRRTLGTKKDIALNLKMK